MLVDRRTIPPRVNKKWSRYRNNASVVEPTPEMRLGHLEAKGTAPKAVDALPTG